MAKRSDDTGTPPTLDDAQRRLREGRLARRDFISIALKSGTTLAAAMAMASLGPLVETAAAGAAPPKARRPNIILILADDMGFSDIGATGSEIRTPHLDRMAREGALLTSMYNAARCCPTRASLLTGLYPHKAGIGHMGANLGAPAYQGYLRDDAATIAEVLRGAGYRTLMAGKWHVGGDLYNDRISTQEAETWPIGAPNHPSPRSRGFDRFYGIMDGVTSYFSPWCIVDDDRCSAVSATDFYFTDAITDKAIAMIEDSVQDEKPFFLYLAHAAPHWPLQAHAADIATYETAYRKGWDELRTARHEEMAAKHLFQHRWQLSPRDENAPAWSEVPFPDWQASRMAVYAAMVDRMDQQIGRVLATLKRLGHYDDTLILFLSDNGGCAEFLAEDGYGRYYPQTTNDGKPIRIGNIPNLRPGSEQTFQSYELPWANVSNTPFRLFKHWVHEGGISTPLVVHWPARFRRRGVVHSPGHVVDIMPTILEAAGATYPRMRGDNTLQPLDGESLLPLLEGRGGRRQQPIYWEHEGNAALRLDNIKLVRRFGAPWELYDMEQDRTELHDLSGKSGRLVDRLAAEHAAWAVSIGVRDWTVLQPILAKAWNFESVYAPGEDKP